jgi:uncharacterized RDD family membrane protein YckC
MTSSTEPRPAGLPRRLAAGIYDLLLLAGLLMLTGFAVLAGRGFQPIPPGTRWWQALLLFVCGSFYTAFWHRGGQTLGMRSWRLRVEMLDGRPLSLGTAALRFVAALGGLGLLWMLVDTQRRALQDRLTGTRVILLSKPDRGR